MKKALSILLAFCLIFCGMVFAGCTADGEIVLEGGPAYDDAVYGNGGYVVSKGNYVYFADSYTKSSSLGSSITNKLGTVTETGLYRAQKTEEGLSEKELMVSKVVGFENAGLYIFKDKLYFATPTINSDSTGVRYDLITFFSCNLDGSNVEKFYQTKEFSSGSFSMTMIDEKVYLLVYTGSEIVCVDQNGNEKSIAKDVTSAVLPSRENITSNSENPVSQECFVYYTVNKEKDGGIDDGNILFKADITTCQTQELLNESRISVTLKGIENGKIYYTRNTIYGAVSSYAYYSNTVGENFKTSETKLLELDENDLSLSIFPLGQNDGTDLGIAFVNNKDNVIVKNASGQTKLVSDITSIKAVKDGYVYYVESSKFYRISLISEDAEAEKLTGDVSSIKTDYFDIDNNCFYFFAEDKTKDDDGNQIKSTAISIYRVDLTTSEITPVKIG